MCTRVCTCDVCARMRQALMQTAVSPPVFTCATRGGSRHPIAHQRRQSAGSATSSARFLTSRVHVASSAAPLAQTHVRHVLVEHPACRRSATQQPSPLRSEHSGANGMCSLRTCGWITRIGAAGGPKRCMAWLLHTWARNHVREGLLRLVTRSHLYVQARACVTCARACGGR
jgi:hypothetical protein